MNQEGRLLEACPHCGDDVDVTGLMEAIKGQALKDVGELLAQFYLPDDFVKSLKQGKMPEEKDE